MNQHASRTPRLADSKVSTVIGSQRPTDLELEKAYRSFSRTTRPAISYASVFAFYSVISILVGVMDTGPWRWLIYADRWLAWNTENILLGVPAILASVRGRTYIRAILLGELRTLEVWAVGLGSGALARAYGVVVSLPVHGPPIPYLHGLSRAYDAGPFAAFFLGPVEEEFLYQIVIQGALQRFGALVAVLGASVLFTGMHFIGDGVSRYDGLLILFPTFILFGVIRQRTKSFGAAVLAHMFFNIFGACLANQH